MARGNKNARAVQRATGWPYMRALNFVKDEVRSREAGQHMRSAKVTKREAFVAIAQAHAEVDDETRR